MKRQWGLYPRDRPKIFKESTMMRHAFLSFPLFLLAACGDDSGPGSSSGQIPLHALDYTPGCWIDPPPVVGPPDTLDHQAEVAAYQLREFQLSFAMQQAQ